MNLGHGDLGVYGAESIATPRIDALAAGGPLEESVRAELAEARERLARERLP